MNEDCTDGWRFAVNASPAPHMSAGPGVLGLTHPAEGEKWFGFNVGDHFFRLVDGDRYVAVLREPSARLMVDAIPFDGDDADPREDIGKLAIAWVQRRQLIPGVKH